MRLNVKIKGQNIEVNINDDEKTKTILDLKNAIISAIRMPEILPKDLKILFAGKMPRDEDKLSDFNIEGDTTVVALLSCAIEGEIPIEKIRQRKNVKYLWTIEKTNPQELGFDNRDNISKTFFTTFEGALLAFKAREAKNDANRIDGFDLNFIKMNEEPTLINLKAKKAIFPLSIQWQNSFYVYGLTGKLKAMNEAERQLVILPEESNRYFLENHPFEYCTVIPVSKSKNTEIFQRVSPYHVHYRTEDCYWVMVELSLNDWTALTQGFVERHFEKIPGFEMYSRKDFYPLKYESFASVKRGDLRLTTRYSNDSRLDYFYKQISDVLKKGDLGMSSADSELLNLFLDAVHGNTNVIESTQALAPMNLTENDKDIEKVVTKNEEDFTKEKENISMAILSPEKPYSPEETGLIDTLLDKIEQARTREELKKVLNFPKLPESIKKLADTLMVDSTSRTNQRLINDPPLIGPMFQSSSAQSGLPSIQYESSQQAHAAKTSSFQG